MDYWVDHVSNAVRFTAGMEALENAKSPEVFLEIGQEHRGLAELEIRETWWMSWLGPEKDEEHHQKLGGCTLDFFDMNKVFCDNS